MTADLDPGVIRRLSDMHAVYRMYDQAGRLLYIGMSGRAGGRFDQHAIKRWFPLVYTVTLEWHATHAAARLAEVRAIATERPRYNVAGSPVAPKRSAGMSRPAQAARPEPPPGPQVHSVLADVLKVFGDAKGLHWQMVADRLAKHFPDRWADVTRDAISAQCRALGIPSVDVRYPGGRGAPKHRGCRRADVEQAAIGRVLAA